MDREIHRGKVTQSSEENEREARREKNRIAAHRCRQNKDKKLQCLKQQNQEIEQDNKKLADEKRELKKQALIHKRLVEEHCRNGCKIPDELMEFWNDVNKMMMEESSSDEDSGDENKLPDVGVTDEIYTPLRSPPNATEAHQQQETALPDQAGHQFEAPTALFSGKPLDALQATRSRSNSSSKSASSNPVSPAQVRLRRTSSSTHSDFFTFQATTGLPSPLAPASTRSTKVVQMQMDPDTPYNAASNIPRTMSNMISYNENVSTMLIKSRDIMQAHTISELPEIQPMGTRCALLDGPIQTLGTVSEKATLEYENGAAERPVLNEAASNQNLLSFNSFLDSVEGYTYSEELFSDATNKEGVNDNIQGWEVAKTNGGKEFQSQSQSEPTISFDTMASAEVSPSLLQQIKTSHGSLPGQAAATIADNDVILAGQNIGPPIKMLASQAEEQSMSSRNQFQSNVLNKHSVTANRQAVSQKETTSSRVRQEGYEQLSRVTFGISANNPIKATVLSHEQLSMLKQKQTLGQNLPSGCSPARNKSATSHQQDIQLGQQVTWTSGQANEANSKADNASEVFVNLYNIKPQTVAHLVAQKNTVAINELRSREITNNNNMDSYSQSSLNIPYSDRPNVPHKRTTPPFVPNTVRSHNATNINTQILSNISSDQIAQHSFQTANGDSRHGHDRLAVEPNNNIYISAPACNPPLQQHVSQVTRANETVKIFSPNVASTNNSVYSSTPTRLNTTSPQFCPQINIISKNQHSSKASNNGCYMYTSSAGNTSAQSDVQNHNTTTSVMTSGGQQYVIDTSLTLPAALRSREIQVSKVINGHPRNTETSCSNTYTADQASITSTSETLLQPTMTISDINSLRVVAPEEHLLMSVTDVAQDTYEHRISVPEDIDYLSESPQAIAQYSF